MRIVGGEARGRRLFAPEGMDTRPTADRVRESLMSILGPRLPGARVIDLFAGSGALALEALSRGAQSAVLCESSAKACQVIRRNIEICKAQDRAQLIQQDCIRALETITGGFDIAFLDPPYRLEALYGQAAEALRARGLLNPGCVLVMEHPSKAGLTLGKSFEIYDERRYGECAIALVREAGNQ